MSIKPIDYISLVSKSQELAKLKQEENNKLQMIVKEGFLEQNKAAKQDMKKVKDTNRSESSIINTNERKKKEEKREKKRNKKNKKTEKKIKSDIGRKIDIKI